MWWLQYGNHWYIYLGLAVAVGAMVFKACWVTSRARARQCAAQEKEAEQKAREGRLADFVEIFGFEPSGSMAPALRAAEQSQVNQCLHDRALKLHKAYRAQKSLRETPLRAHEPSKNFRDAHLKRIQDLEEAGSKVEEAKRAFWTDAWRPAKDFGFLVCERYNGHLTVTELGGK